MAKKKVGRPARTKKPAGPKASKPTTPASNLSGSEAIRQTFKAGTIKTADVVVAVKKVHSLDVSTGLSRHQRSDS